MYIVTPSSSSALLRVSRVRFSSSLSSFSSSLFRNSTSPSLYRPSVSFPQSSPSAINNRSLSFSSAFRSLRSSVPRWSHGVDWRSPVSLKAQIRAAAPVIERFQRKISTMASENAFKGILTSLPKPGGGEFGKFYSLPALNDPRIDKLPYTIKILLESAIRNCDNFQVTKDDVEKIIDWEKTSPKQVEIPFKPARVLLQDFTGVPAVVDLACMRDAMNKLGSDSNKINPLVPVDLVIDHSVQVDVARSENAVQANMDFEFQRNKERFAFLKWGSTAFHNMLVVPPGSGIVHQVNLEYLGRVVFNTDGILYPDSVVGTDSHTTMIDGLGVAGWGVGGIEAESVMLGQPMSMVLPGVVGFKKHGVVGKFVEFYGEGMGALSLADRATIANMSPEYGATMGFFPVDQVTLQYLKLTGRSDETVARIEAYLRANKMFVDYNEPQQERVYTSYLQLDLADVEPCISGPKRPHDRVPLKEMKADWHSCLDNKVGFKGFAVPKEAQNKVAKFSFHGQPAELKHGSVVIAAITSCTNTSNPSVMLGAGLVAKKASELGLEVKPWVKTSLAPGSGVVTKYLLQSGLQKYLNQQGFNIVGYGCTTCIGNSGDLDESVASAISDNDIIAAAVLSGNRNFEGRVHALTRANYLASPPLVVAYALAGRVDIDFDKEPIGTGKDGKSVYFKDIWPSNEEIAEVVQSSVLPEMFKSTYEAITKGNPMWNQLSVPSSSLCAWDPNSTYIHEPPYFKDMTMDPPGSIHKDSPAAKYLLDRGVDRKDFNSYGSRRGNDEVMARGTFANIRIVNKLLNGEVGPRTIHIPTGEKLYVFDAAMRYKAAGQETIVLAGAEYGSGSSRDWAAKGPMLLGVKAVIAKSFERIHRSNLVGMGIIPLCFKSGEDADTLGLTGHERYSIDLPSKVSEIKPGQDVTVTTDTGKSFTCTARFDTEVELAYFDHGGILPYVIRYLKNMMEVAIYGENYTSLLLALFCFAAREEMSRERLRYLEAMAIYCEAIAMVEEYQQAVSVANLGGIRDVKGLYPQLGLKNSPQVYEALEHRLVVAEAAQRLRLPLISKDGEIHEEEIEKWSIMSRSSLDSTSTSVTISSSSNSTNYTNISAISTGGAGNNALSSSGTDAAEPGVGGVPNRFLGITPAYLWQTQLQQAPLSMDMADYQMSLFREIEGRLKAKYSSTGTQNSSARLPERVKLIIEEIEREEATLREDLYSADRKFAEYYNVLEQILGVLIKLVKDLKLQHQHKYDELQKSWLCKRCETMNAKLRVLEHILLLETYTQESIPALHKIRRSFTCIQ
ncbi:hypothetical protein F0562_010097 [Nyssa sinensis]|uniref:aconitate hydratase n=3 Tax=Magnoliopsida TaxID=3398 RepID=A0A5J5A0J0_9ASTE|nr:hypothetical protein F0562_010097 [Nyssa sinensis]